MKKIPLITVSCIRDLPLLELQAQSIFNYLDKECPIFIIVNEHDSSRWFKEFNKSIRKYYNNHTLTIFTLDDFNGQWNLWIPSPSNPWHVGWEIQQILKLIISEKIESDSYLVLDCQNFLINAWSPSQYYTDNRIPARLGHYVMPENIWNDYCKSLDIETQRHPDQVMSICTPIFLSTTAIKDLINIQGGTKDFIRWFKSASRIKSEFILYALWLEKLGGLEKYHNMIEVVNDWANPYLRDCYDNQSFDDFISFVGEHKPHSWVSINHRAWGNMSPNQYDRLCDKLRKYNLYPKFDEYRSSYIDLKI